VPIVSTTSPSSHAGRLSPFRGRRRAEQFAQLLEGQVSDSALRTDPQLAPLVDLAQALRAMPLGPAPDFRANLRQRLVAVGTVQGVGEVSLPAAVRNPARSPGLATLPSRVNEWAEGWRVRRRFITVTAAASAVVVVGGIGLAGSRSLPGEPFYGVKRGVERAQLAMAGSTEAKGERHLQFARTRLHEVAALVKSPEAIGLRLTGGSSSEAGGSALGGSLSSRVISTLHNMDDETTAGTKDLTTAFARTHDSHSMNVLAGFATAQRTKLVAVIPQLPAAATPRAEQSLALIERVDARAHSLLTAPTCSAACQPQTPTPGATMTPAPGDDLGTTPCSCTQSNNTGGSDQNGGQPAPAPSATPSQTTQPSNHGTSSPPPNPSSPSPSPSSPDLQNQIGNILSQLPLPVTPPPVPLPDLPPLPVPVPTIHLPH
jgi:hypothetical protein